MLNIAIAQQNPTVGDFDRNTSTTLTAMHKAATAQAHLLVCPELSTCGYYPGDLLEDPAFLSAMERSVTHLVQASQQYPHLTTIIGAARRNTGPGKPLHNALLAIRNGVIVAEYYKQLLPTYGIFDEYRHFEPGPERACVLEIAGHRIGFMVCEDGWNDAGRDYPVNPFAALRAAAPELVVSINASPAHIGKAAQRHALFGAAARHNGFPILFVNQVGGQDQLVFDGASFGVTAAGEIAFGCAEFEEALCVVGFDGGLFDGVGVGLLGLDGVTPALPAAMPAYGDAASTPGAACNSAPVGDRIQTAALPACRAEAAESASGDDGVSAAACDRRQRAAASPAPLVAATLAITAVAAADSMPDRGCADSAADREASTRPGALPDERQAGSAGSSAAAYYRRQILLGLRDYARRCGFTRAVIGSSGGIDSAVTIALAAEALGPENVTAITMPSAWSSGGSVSDSVALCDALGVRLYTHPIAGLVRQYAQGYEQAFGQALHGLPLENLQARIRGTVLMEYSNAHGALLLTTGNKSEISVGYCTLYGDTNGGLGLIGDLYKTEVYDLARHLNGLAGRDVIPAGVLDKPPSAELAPGQRDTDSLPPYDVLDDILKWHIEGPRLAQQEWRDAAAFVERLRQTDEGRALVRRILSLVARNEYKRRQAPPIIRLRPRAFGSGRQLPIAAKHVEELA